MNKYYYQIHRGDGQIQLSLLRRDWQLVAGSNEPLLVVASKELKCPKYALSAPLRLLALIVCCSLPITGVGKLYKATMKYLLQRDS